MKKYLIVILPFLFMFMGCSPVPMIKSDNGSFRNSLKSQCYEKDDYILDTFSGNQAAGDVLGILMLGLPIGSIVEGSKPQQMLNNVDIDEVIQRGRITAYLLNIYSIRYIKSNKDGLKPTIDDDKIWVSFQRIYVDNKTRGFEITIYEEFGIKCYAFVTYQEVTMNKEGEYIIRENISKEEATRKRIKWEDSQREN